MKLNRIAILPLAIVGLCAYATQTIATGDEKDKKQADKHDHAGDDHDHDHDHSHAKVIAGPNGGRVLASVEPHLEFFVNDDRTVKITVLDDKLKPAKLGKQSVRIVAGDRKNPTKLSFEEKDGVLVSDGKLPDGNDFPIVVQIKSGKLGKRVNEKFNVNLKDCPTCDYKEYACTCDHHHGAAEEDGHDHDHHDKKK